MIPSLSDATWVDVPQRPLVLVPVGSTEQHGPHLPLSTDGLIAAAVARRVAEGYAARERKAVVVAPTLAYGASGEHQDFPGTVSIGHEALRFLLVELVRSLSTWAGRIVFINGHGGNVPTLKAVVEQMTFERHAVSAVTCALESGTDAHAGHDETSVLLYLHPEHVVVARAEEGNTAPLVNLLPDLMARGVRPVSPNGILGDPTGATASEGERLFAAIVRRVLGEVSND
jgi:mycofactocin system creatininase family protein